MTGKIRKTDYEPKILIINVNIVLIVIVIINK